MSKRDSLMKRLAISFAAVAALIFAAAAWSELRAPSPRLVELSSLAILTLTLVVLVWYAYDTNQIARATSDRWLREGVLSTTYNLAMPGASVGDVGRTFVQLTNGSPLVVTARVNFNFRVYGQPVSAGALYDGQEPWLLYPHQVSQGWFEVESLLRQQGRSVAQVRAELGQESARIRLTARLELAFEDEFGTTRQLPPRAHYFDFERWAWIPQLGVQS